MTKEYTEREEALAAFRFWLYDKEQATGDIEKSFNRGIDRCIKELNAQIAADVAPVVHGNWIVPRFLAFHVCSICRNDALYDDEGTEILAPYCPNCGAKMDGGD